MQTHATASRADQNRALSLSTIAFTACFAVWTIFSIIGVAIKAELGLNDTQFGLLVATPILTGSVTRLFLGVWAEKYGGRLVFSGQMILTALATWALTLADSYILYLVAALGIGLAGGSFIIGVAYVSRWYEAGRQGTALGIFGAGNVGAAITKFVAPFVMVAYGWHGVAYVWAVGLAIIGVLFPLLAKDDPDLVERRRSGTKVPSLAQQFAPLRNLQVWRFALYYFFVFGAFVALALWLPHYLIDVYGIDVRAAGMAAASFSLSASLFRAYGGVLSDKFGARKVMYWTFGFSLLLLFMLSYPPTDYVIYGKDGPIAFSTAMGLAPFIATLFALGFFMSLGKAAVFKHIPVYYPNHVGAVGGLVGMIGGLGGFVLPITFGALLDLTGIYTSCFALLFGLVAIALTWMHLSVRAMERSAHGEVLDRLPELPEMQPIHHHERTDMPRVLEDWRPEDAEFWAETGRAVARRNLWISIPALLLAFSVWMVWSVVVARLPAIGFDFTPGQLFWLAALPGLSGASLRIFYSLDLVLERLAADLAAQGLRCCGTVQINSERADAGPCDMDVRVLPDGAVLRISQDLGPQSRGCRLDPVALEAAVKLVTVSLSSGADLLVVNKFGKHEAEGRGFRSVIAEAIAMGIPVLVGLNALNRPAFERFADGLAIQVPPEPEALMAWIKDVIARAHELAGC